jgi:short-subunit dehydrogenase
LDLVLVARQRDRLDTLARRLHRARDMKCLAVACDLSVRQAASEIDRACEGTRIGLLVAADGHGTSGSFLNSPLADESGMIEVK